MRWPLVLSLLCGSLIANSACSSQLQVPAFAAIASPIAEGSEMLAAPRIVNATGPARDTGTGNVNVRVLVAGQVVPAHIRIFDASGNVASEAESGTPISLRAGSHRIELQVSDAASMADTPKQGREIFLEAGKTIEVEATFPWAKIQLNVMVHGRSQPGVVVKLLRNGQVVAEMKGGAKPTAITPGKYEADVMLKGMTIRVKGLMFLEGATQTVPVRVQS
jgi:hypothetical protein